MKRLLLILAFWLIPLAAGAQSVPLPMQGSTAAEASHLFSGTKLFNLTVTWQSATTARYLFVFDSNSTGTHSTTPCSSSQVNGCLLYCMFMPNSTSAPSAQTWAWNINPILARNGFVTALSTGAGCGTFTADGSNDFYFGQIEQ